jgi:hypothetical protein
MPNVSDCSPERSTKLCRDEYVDGVPVTYLRHADSDHIEAIRRARARRSAWRSQREECLLCVLCVPMSGFGSSSFCSNLAHATVDAEFGTSDKAAFVGGEKQRSCRHLVGSA